MTSGQRAVALAVTAGVLALTVALAWFVRATPGSVIDGAEGRPYGDSSGDGASVLVEVESGQSAKEIGDTLEDAGVIESAQLFELLVGIRGVADSLEAGEYEFDRGMPAIAAVDRIAEGQTASRDVTIPEGLRAEEIGELLERRGVVSKDAFLAALVKAGYAEPFLQETASDSLEGYLFPARYSFFRSTTADQVVATLLRGFQDNVADRVQFEGQELRLDQVVTLASIVEREAVVAEERPIIAGVFINRLRVGLPLQADPTVQFAAAADPASVSQYGWWKRELTLDDLKIDSPYNTYVYDGLPPGPIANPGVDAIQAVVRPADTDFLFFVSRNDGTHVFAETLEEHLQNVEIYQGR
ncbi:MAG: endolytic transglycosylase MltG [Dehalococcoidia bacterium]